MSRTQMAPLLHHLYQAVSRVEINHLSDGQLLERFARGQGEDAFAALVHRHGPLVLGVCRRVLRQSQDAEDVFQASFLMLARQAASIRLPGSLAGWLYRVTYRLAVKVNRESERRRTVPLAEVLDPASRAEPWREFLAVLDEELHALPEKYRLALVLCYLEGQTRDQVAQQLGWSRRTVLRRLEEGRQRLRERLTRHGVTLPAALLAIGLVQPARAALPLELIQRTAQAAALMAAGNELVAQIVPAHVLDLAKGGLQTMTKFKLALALLVALGGAGLGAGTFRYPAQAANPPPGTVKPSPAAKARPVQSPLSPDLWADLASPERGRVARALMALGAAPPSDAVAFLKKRLHPVKDDPERTPRLIADLDSKELTKRQTAAEELEYLGKFAVPYLKSALAAKPPLEMRKRIEQIMARTKPPVQNSAILGGGFPQMPNGGLGGLQLLPAGGLGGGGFPQMPNGGLGGFGQMPKGGLGGGGIQVPKGGLGGLGQIPKGGFGGVLHLPIGGFGGFQQLPKGGFVTAPPKPPAVWLRAVWSIAVLEQFGTPESRKILQQLADGSADALPTKEAKAALGRLAKR